MSGKGIGGQASQNAPAAPRVPAVVRSIGSIDEQLFRLEELAGQLLSRISPLISPAVNGKNDAPTPVSGCDFALVLDGKAERIREVADRLSCALERLEF